MEQNILDCLHNSPSTTHILPFFWQHGEEHDLLTKEIDAIYQCGIREFCVESRTHEQFCEDKWWEDFGFILEQANARGMRVWLLDDKRFPTGYANNYVGTHPELRAVSARYAYYDFVGPQNDIAVIAEHLGPEEDYISVVAYRREQNGNVMTGEAIDLLENCDENGLLWWDIPEGNWRICYTIRTKNTGPSGQRNYIDMLSAESCKAMVHAIYQPHYDRFADYFGNTFAGFFSDEPSFANANCSYYSIIGKTEMFLPWNDELVTMIADKTGKTQTEIKRMLPALWHEIEGSTALIREAYMDAVTEQYSRNFSWMLGDWCRAHGVMYIGHIIEDMNTHQRLGCGPGHFFRALDGQDMAGCDVVLNQIALGHRDLDFHLPVWGGVADPAFFNYTMAKLASSHSHIQPLKQNRAMCELFGAFGWAEGVPTMKYLADHMLVSGINHFVPHAFNAKYPDADCPPHFYAGGNNSQFPLFAELMGYLARMAHILSGGIHRADVAVYYNAEAEWAGGDYMLQQEVCRKLARAQIDFDLIPQDVLVTSKTQGHRLAIHQETYGAIIVPYSQYLPKTVLDAFDRLSQAGVPVIFIDKLPDSSTDGQPLSGVLAACNAIPLDEIAVHLVQNGHRSVTTAMETDALRFYHIERGKHHVCMLWNEDHTREIDTDITLPTTGQAVVYDGWTNRAFTPAQNGHTIRVKLAPCAAIIVCVGDDNDQLPAYDYTTYPLTDVALDWDISIRESTKPEFVPYRTGKIGNLAKELPRFGGVIRYETVWTVNDADAIHVLDLGRVGETAQLWINGTYVGSCVTAPFRFDMNGVLQNGENHIRIEVMTNLGYLERDMFSRFVVLPPTGLVGPVCIG